MAERPCIDSDVLRYAVAWQGEKRRLAPDVVGRGGVISVQAPGAAAHVPRRTAALSLGESAEALRVLRAKFELVPLTLEVRRWALWVAEVT